MKTRFVQNNFLSGELSPLLYGNTSLQQYYNGLQKAENVVIVPQGGVKRRAGLAFGINPSTTSDTSNIKLVPISTSYGFSYLCVITDANIRVYDKSLTLINTLTTPYAEADISTIRYATAGNVTLLFHESYAPRRITNYGDASLGNSKLSGSPTVYWTIDTPSLTPPKYDYNDGDSPTPVSAVQVATFGSFSAGDTYEIDVGGVLSKQITYAGDGTADEQSSTAENLRKNLQDMPTFGDTGISVARTGTHQYTITIAGESADTFELFSGFSTDETASASITFTITTAGSPRKEDIWSSTRGYPSVGGFHGNRLWLGGVRDKKDALIGSKAGELLNFDTGEGDDNQGIFVILQSDSNAAIRELFSGRNLQIYTAGAERAQLDDPITPSNINPLVQTSNGALNIDAAEADGAVVFADKNGKTLRENIYNFNEDAYVATDITVLASHLINSPVSMSFLTGTTSEDANWLFITNSDGDATILNKLRAQDINGFTKMTTQGDIKSTAVVDNEVFCVVERSVNGSDIRYIERWDFDYRLDSSVKTTISSATVSGFSHLEGETVRARVGDVVLDDRVVTSGDITLTTAEFNEHNGKEIEVGLGFVPTIQSMPLTGLSEAGENSMRIRKVNRMNLRVRDTFGLHVDGELLADRKFGEGVLNSDVPSTTGVIEDVFTNDGFDRENITPIFTCPNPTPMFIQAIEYEVETA